MMEVEVTALLLKYGVSTVAMAFIVMCMVGVVKIFTKGIINKKIVSDSKKKWLAKLYLGLALVFSYIVSLIYYAAILKENCWTFECIKFSGVIWTLTSPLYQLYKQFGGRKFLIWFVSLFKGKNKDTDSIIDVIEKILNDEAPLLTDAQKEAINNRLTSELGTTNANDNTAEKKE
jgi:hypothetical protein